MTFAVVGRCARTGMLGVAMATSSIAVGSRCPHARAGVGAVTSQNVTDPKIGPEILDRLAAGDDAESALAHVMRDRPFAGYRQVAVIDAQGRTAGVTGADAHTTTNVTEGADCIAAGNILTSTEVTNAIAAAFESVPDAHLAERLVAALEAGDAAGGEVGPIHSATLLVAHEHPFPLVDLRVDWADADPLKVLRRLWERYEAEMDAYVLRAINPPKAPGYNVPGIP